MTNHQAKIHATHLKYHSDCTFCVTEVKLGTAPKLIAYDAALTRKLKESK
jgi:hypothetical protein